MFWLKRADFEIASYIHWSIHKFPVEFDAINPATNSLFDSVIPFFIDKKMHRERKRHNPLLMYYTIRITYISFKVYLFSNTCFFFF